MNIKKHMLRLLLVLSSVSAPLHADDWAELIERARDLPIWLQEYVAWNYLYSHPELLYGKDTKVPIAFCKTNVLSISPNNEKILTAAQDGTVTISCTKTGKKLGEFKPDTAPDAWKAPEVLFSPDGTKIATLTRNTGQIVLQMWDAASYTEILIGKKFWTGDNLPISELACFSNDGTKILVRHMIHPGMYVLTVHDVNTGQSWQLPPVYNTMNPQLSPDNNKVVTCHRNCIKIWDVREGKIIAQYDTDTNYDRIDIMFGGYSINFHPTESKIMLAPLNASGPIRFCGTNAQEILAEFQLNAAIKTAELSPDGSKILILTSNNTVEVLDAQTGEVLTLLEHKDDFFCSAHFSHDGTAVVTTTSTATCIWDVDTGRPRTQFRYSPTARPEAYDLSGSFVRLSTDGTKAATREKHGTVRIWGADSQGMLAELANINTTSLVGFTPDGTMVVTMGTRRGTGLVDNVQIYDLQAPVRDDLKKLYSLNQLLLLILLQKTGASDMQRTLQEPRMLHAFYAFDETMQKRLIEKYHLKLPSQPLWLVHNAPQLALGTISAGLAIWACRKFPVLGHILSIAGARYAAKHPTTEALIKRLGEKSRYAAGIGKLVPVGVMLGAYSLAAQLLVKNDYRLLQLLLRRLGNGGTSKQKRYA